MAASPCESHASRRPLGRTRGSEAVARALTNPVGAAAVSRQRVVDPLQDVIELDLLDVLRRVDPEARDAQARERHQVAGDLLTDRCEAGVQVWQ